MISYHLSLMEARSVHGVVCTACAAGGGARELLQPEATADPVLRRFYLAVGKRALQGQLAQVLLVATAIATA